MSTSLVRHDEVWDGGALRENVFIMDVRTPAEFQEAHIPGSVNLPLGDVERQESAVMAHAADADMAIVCHTMLRSRAVHDELERRGLRSIPILRGGMVSWMEAGLPVVQGEKTFSLQRQVQIAAGSLTLLGVLLGAFVSPWFLVLAGLMGAGLVHAGATDTCAFAVFLARLPFNRSTHG